MKSSTSKMNWKNAGQTTLNAEQIHRFVVLDLNFHNKLIRMAVNE